jgi:hypothetical protein
MPKYPPADDVRDVIAESLHVALLRMMHPSIMHIGPINTIGCFLLKYLTGEDYVPVAGSIEVRCGGTPFGLQAHIENIDIHAYYVWIECDRGAGGTELVDFGSRYWRSWASDEGALWTAPSPPNYIWERKDHLSGTAEYVTHHEISAIVLHAIENAVSAQEPEANVKRWETVINSAVDHMLDTKAGLRFLIDAGIAQPADEEEEPFQ